MIDNDDVFDALANGQRRRVAVGLLEEDPRRIPGLSGASREVAEAHDALIEDYVSGSLELPDVDDELVRLHHVHLPKLEEYGFVEVYRDPLLVTKGPRFDELRPLLEVLKAHRDQRSERPPPTSTR